jgi:hypothetical protein
MLCHGMLRMLVIWAVGWVCIPIIRKQRLEIVIYGFVDIFEACHVTTQPKC